jgi:hypothetical protein
MLNFRGGKILGTYQLRKMRWYPGNRWMLTRLQNAAVSPGAAHIGDENR